MSDPRRSQRSSSVHSKLEFALLDGLREKHDRPGTLNLENRRFERVDLPICPELYRAEEGHDVQLRQLVAHLIFVQRSGALNCDLEQCAAKRRRRLSIIRIALVFLMKQLHEIAGGTKNIRPRILLGRVPPRSTGEILCTLGRRFDK